MPRFVARPWALLGLVSVLVAVVGVVYSVVRLHSNGCVFDDGQAYCAMARGLRAPQPFSRRLAVPALVSGLPSTWSLVDRFRLLSLLSVALVVIGSYLLTRRLLSRTASDDTRRWAPVCAAALVSLSPHTVKLATLAPVLVDQTASAVGLAWVLSLLARRPALVWSSPVAALAVVLVREAWTLPVLAVASLLFVQRRRRLAAATAAAGVLGLGVVTMRPAVPGPYSSSLAALHSAHVALVHPFDTLWSLIFGVGVVSFLLILIPRAWWTLPRDATSVAGVVVVSHLLLAVVGGADASRLASAALPFSVSLTVAALCGAERRATVETLTVAALASVLLWRPWVVVRTGTRPYFGFYYPGSLLDVAGTLAAVAVALFISVRLWRRHGLAKNYEE